MDIKSDLPKRINEARERIRMHIRKTPLDFSPFLSKLATDSEVYIKYENEQVTGSFKARGAFNKCLLLSESEADVKQKGFITASTGNHGMACIMASRIVGAPLEIFCREGVQEEKKSMMLAYGGNLVLSGQDCLDAELKARSTAEERRVPYISPYNDIDVVAGQGTIGIELLEDVPDLDAVFIAVGGGGLIGGIASYIKSVQPGMKIIGCTPELSKVMYESVKSGQIIFEDSGETLSDGTSGALEENSVTFDLCVKHVDEWILVTEEQIAKAVYFMIDKHHKIVEGAAGVAIAAFIENASKFAGKKIAIISCGCNISSRKLKMILSAHCPA